MAAFAIVENSSNEVVNIIDWEGAEWLPPRNHLVIRADGVNIGDIYDQETKTFSRSKD